MKSTGIRSPKPKQNTPALQQPNGLPAQMPRALPPSPSEDLQVLIAQRAYERYVARGYRQGFAFDDWLEAEREILNQNSSA